MKGHDLDNFTGEELAEHLREIADELESRAFLSPASCDAVVMIANEARVAFEKTPAAQYA